MQITMPSQDPMAEQEFSLASRNIRKWLKALPYIDSNVAAQQFYDGLRRSNRQAYDTKQRLVAIELMRPVAHQFLKEQKKYLLTQTFPLSKCAQEILKLQQNILNELAVAYKIIIQETANRDSQLSQRKLLTCVFRAMRYMIEQYITLAQVYSEPPQGYWQDICQLYKMAEHIGMEDLSIYDDPDIKKDKSSAKCLLKQACLLSLANLHTYGHGEAEKIAAYFKTNSSLVELYGGRVVENKSDTYFINLALNKLPRLTSTEEIPISSENRFLDLSKLTDQLQELIEECNEEQAEVIFSRSTLNRSIAKRLLNKLIYKPKRLSKRAKSSKSKLNIVLGFRDSVDALQSHDEPNSSSNDSAINQIFELLPIGSDVIGPTFDNEQTVDSISNAWDWVGKGNVINDSFGTPKKQNREKKATVKINPVIQSWDINNASNGGYCLQSDNTSDYQAQVGDLVLLRLEENSNDAWRLGVIRWMQSIANSGVKIGIETFKGDVQLVKVMDSQMIESKLLSLEYIIQLCEENGKGNSATLIAPPNSIAVGEQLELKLGENKKTVTFQHVVERTISFARFTCSVS